MSKSKKKYVITSKQLFDFNKSHYNSYACGHGAHKNKKAYDRKKERAEVRKINREWT